MSRKKLAVILCAILVAAAAAVGIWYVLGSDGKDSKDRVYVEKVSVIMGNVTGAQNRYSGVVQPQETIEVNTDPERTVSEVLVKVGDAVEEGTPLFNYDTEDLNLELEQAKLELQNQDIEINNYKSQIQELEKERKDAAEGDKFEYTTQIQTVQTQIKQAEFEKSSKQLEIDKIQKKVDNSQALSKAAGVVKNINDGNSQEEESSAFITILSTGEYRIKGTANEQNVNMIASGLDVIIRSRVDETITWTGTIDNIDTEETASDSNDDMSFNGEENAAASSDYSFFVSMDDIDGLMLGQHVLIELDEGQTETKEGIWLYSGYIAFDDLESGALESINGATESMEAGSETLFGMEEGTESFWDYEPGMEMPSTEDMDDWGYPYVWADDGNGKLEKRDVELGEYDAELDQYEIVSGLSEDDLIAFPMEGLYEGITTVTDESEIDYSSGLYNQGNGTEEMWDNTEWNEFDGVDGIYDEGIYDDGSYDDADYDDGSYDGADYDDGSYDDSDYDDGSYDDADYDDEGYDYDDAEMEEESGDSDPGSQDDRLDSDKKGKLDLWDFLRAEGIL